MKLKSSFGPRLISVKWDKHLSESFPVEIEIDGIDNIGVLNRITHIISDDMAVNIRNLTISTNEGLFHGEVGVMVHDARDIEKPVQPTEKNRRRKIGSPKELSRLLSVKSVPFLKHIFKPRNISCSVSKRRFICPS